MIELPKDSIAGAEGELKYLRLGGRLPTKAHLLIVDDEANTLASLARAFRLAGHEATVCDNAGQGAGAGARHRTST